MDEFNNAEQAEQTEQFEGKPKGCWASRRGAGTAGALAGMVIIGIGVLLLLDNFGLFRFHDIWKLWPLWIIAAGVGKFIDCGHSNGRAVGILITIVGAMFLISNFGLAHVSWSLFWGMALIFLGANALLKQFGGRQQRAWPAESTEAAAHDFADRLKSGIEAAASWTHEKGRTGDWAVFGGTRRRVDSEEYTGGEAFAMFGGVNLDLRGAHMKEDSVVLDATAIFGGIEIRVPEDWGVSVRGTGIFGAFEDKTGRRRSDAPKPEHYLIVTGFALFGGVEVKN